MKNKENLFKHSLDVDKFEHGRSLLILEFPAHKDYPYNTWSYKMIYSDLISSAKRDIATGAKYLSRKYIGQKRYEGFDQRTDCEYGYGPSHGSIYQRIGLRSPSKTLSEYDIECCLYVLENLEVVLEDLNRQQKDE